VKAFSSVEKTQVRQADLNLISELSKKANRKLRYLGLPSPWMGDVVTWKPYLDRVFAVEREKRYLSHLMDMAFGLGLVNQVVYFWGDIDTILSSQVDEYGKSVAGIFPVDLINLDYCGGLVYADFKHIQALESCIRLQAKGIQSMGRDAKSNTPYFLLLLTHNYKAGKTRVGKQYALDYLAREISLYNIDLQRKIHQVLNWLKSSDCPAPYRHKVFLIGKVKEFSESLGLAVRVESIVCYEGDQGAPMMHYQLKLTPKSIGHPVPTDSGLLPIDILDFPVLDTGGHDIDPNRPRIQG